MSITEKAMQNRHLFRGKRVDNGEWAYGGRCEIPPPPQCVGGLQPSRVCVFCEHPNTLADWGMSRRVYLINVDPATTGQCTSLPASKSYRGGGETDRLVFEGDIVREDNNTAIVKFGYYTANDNKSYCNEEAYGFYLEYLSHSGVIDHISDFICWEIIGNIHDNIKAEDE